MAYAPDNRVYTCDMAIMQVGWHTGYEAGTGYEDFLGILRNVRLSITKDFIDPAVPQDVMQTNLYGFKKKRFKRRRWTVDLSGVVDSSVPQALLLYLALVRGSGGSEKNRGFFTVRFYRPGTSGGAASYYSGGGFITEATFTVGGEGPILQSGTITGVGPLVQNGA